MTDFTAIPANSQRRLTRWLLPIAVFLIMTAVTLLVSSWQSRIQASSREIANNQISAAMTTEVRERLYLYAQFLRSLQAFASAHPDQGLLAWQRYAEQIDITNNLSGLLSFAYAPAVNTEEVSKFIFTARQEVDRSSFDIFPKPAGKIAVPVFFIAPDTPNLRTAIGFDLLSETVRRQAIDTAISHHNVAMTGPISLVIETNRPRPAFLLVDAIYHHTHSLDNVSQRHLAFRGIVLTAYYVDDFFASLKHAARSNFTLQVFDESLADSAPDGSAPVLIYDTDPDLKPLPDSPVYHHEVDFGGRNWILEFRPRTNTTNDLAFNLPSVILYGGLLGNILLTLLVFHISTHRERAERYADLVTFELRQHRDHLNQLVDERTARLSAALQQVRAASQAKSEFLTNMSHELRTPMHAILSFSQLGIQRATTDGQAKAGQYFLRIEQSASRLLGLINELLDLSKLESDRAELTLVPTKLNDLLDQAGAQLESLLLTHKLQLEITSFAPDNMIQVDPSRITQVIFNLLANAIKFSPEHATIHVEIRPATLALGRRADDSGSQPALSISIIDSGIGIPPEELESIFDKFEQSSATRSGAGGTGLGLAISRAIVMQHRGTIIAKNNIGGGACFIMTLPVDAGMGISEA